MHTIIMVSGFSNAIGKALFIIWKIAKYSILTITGLVLLFTIIIPLCLTFLGYRVDEAGWETANIAWEKKDVSICDNIIAYNIFGPPTGERIALCIRDYAEKSKDPTICESLMPSSYGISCVGAAENHALPCGTEKYTVYWDEDGQPHQATLEECVSAGGDHAKMRMKCCTVAKTRYLLGENNCISVKDDIPVYDRCLYGLAWKKKDPEFCTKITNTNAKAACLVQTRALQKDPSICSGCTPAIESMEDL